MEFIFNVNKDKLRLKVSKNAVSGNANSYTCRFNFSDEYKELDIYAVFECKGEHYTVEVKDNACVFPYEALESESIIRIGIFASGEKNGDFFRISTNYVGVNIETGAYSIYSAPKGPDMWEKYLNDVKEARKSAESSAQKAEQSMEIAQEAEKKAEDVSKILTEAQKGINDAVTEAQKAKEGAEENAQRAETAADEAEKNAQNILNSLVFYDSDEPGTWLIGQTSSQRLESGQSARETFGAIGGFRGYSNWASINVKEENGLKEMKFISGNTASDATFRMLAYAFNRNAIISPKYRRVTLTFRLDPTRNAAVAARAAGIWEGLYVQSVGGFKNLNITKTDVENAPGLSDDDVILFWFSRGHGVLYSNSTGPHAYALRGIGKIDSNDFVTVEYIYALEQRNGADAIRPVAFKVNGVWVEILCDGNSNVGSIIPTTASELSFREMYYNAGEYPMVIVPAINNVGTTITYRKIKFEALSYLPAGCPALDY